MERWGKKLKCPLFWFMAKHMTCHYNIATARQINNSLTVFIRNSLDICQKAQRPCSVSCAWSPWQESLPLRRLDGLHHRWPRGRVEVCAQPHHCEEIHLLPGHGGHQRSPRITGSADVKKRYGARAPLITTCGKTPPWQSCGCYATLRAKQTTKNALTAD